MSESFADVQALCDPKVGRGARRGNIVFLAQTTPGRTDEVELDRLLRKLPLPARPLRGKELGKWRAGIRPLTDEAVGWALVLRLGVVLRISLDFSRRLGRLLLSGT